MTSSDSRPWPSRNSGPRSRKKTRHWSAKARSPSLTAALIRRSGSSADALRGNTANNRILVRGRRAWRVARIDSIPAAVSAGGSCLIPVLLVPNSIRFRQRLLRHCFVEMLFYGVIEQNISHPSVHDWAMDDQAANTALVLQGDDSYAPGQRMNADPALREYRPACR